MVEPSEKAERAVSVMMRLGISAVLPLWAVAMVVVGLRAGSLWWMGCGVAVGVVGLVLLAGSPIFEQVLSRR